MDDNDENQEINGKHSIISVRSVFNNHNVRLPAQIWRALSKVNLFERKQLVNVFFHIGCTR